MMFDFSKIRIIIGYECSGAMRRAFRSYGFDAWSCDIQPARDRSPYHLLGDIWDFLGPGYRWDMGIFHPPCTYLTNSAAWAFGDGPYHQNVKPGTLVGQGRRDARDAALADVARLLNLPFPRAVENPRGFIGTMLCPATQMIQPYEFGDDASKGTCLWLRDLPPLKPTRWFRPRMVNGKPRWGNQTDSGQNKLSPSDDRADLRSETFPGIAMAAARQWGGYITGRGVLPVLKEPAWLSALLGPEPDDIDLFLGAA